MREAEPLPSRPPMHGTATLSSERLWVEYATPVAGDPRIRRSLHDSLTWRRSGAPPSRRGLDSHKRRVLQQEAIGGDGVTRRAESLSNVVRGCVFAVQTRSKPSNDGIEDRADQKGRGLPTGFVRWKTGYAGVASGLSLWDSVDGAVCGVPLDAARVGTRYRDDLGWLD